jgi:hypothetical protein
MTLLLLFVLASLPAIVVNAFGLSSRYGQHRGGTVDMSLKSDEAKQRLRVALIENGGVTKSPAVAQIIDELAELNPGKNKIKSNPTLILGNSRALSSPEFSGSLGLNDSGAPMYTLGRMAFSMYQPLDLVCAITKVEQPISYGSLAPGEYNYDVVISFTAEAEPGRPPLKGKLINYAVGSLGKSTDSRFS